MGAWSKPRLLLELLPRVSWQYLLVVDADALPLQYGRSWEYLVKRHMRHRRYANDDTDRRHIFCPENCEAGAAKQKRREDACSGALLSGCSFWRILGVARLIESSRTVPLRRTHLTYLQRAIF